MKPDKNESGKHQTTVKRLISCYSIISSSSWLSLSGTRGTRRERLASVSAEMMPQSKRAVRSLHVRISFLVKLA